MNCVKHKIEIIKYPRHIDLNHRVQDTLFIVLLYQQQQQPASTHIITHSNNSLNVSTFDNNYIFNDGSTDGHFNIS